MIWMKFQNENKKQLTCSNKKDEDQYYKMFYDEVEQVWNNFFY